MDLISFGFYNKNDALIFKKIIDKYSSMYLSDKYEEIEKRTGDSLEKLKIYFNLYVFSSIICVYEEMLVYDSTELVQEIGDYYNKKINGKKTFKPPIFFDILDELDVNNINEFILVFSEEFNEEVITRFEEINFESLKDRLCRVYVWNEYYFNFTTKSFITDHYYPLVLRVEKQLFKEST